MDMHKNERIGPILASVANDYRRQITYPDRVHIGVRITRIGRSSMDMEHKIFSQNDHALAAEGTSTLVVFDYQTKQVLHRPRPHPPRRRDPRGADVLKRGLLEDRSPFVPPLHRNFTIFSGDTPPFPWYNASTTNPTSPAPDSLKM